MLSKVSCKKSPTLIRVGDFLRLNLEFRIKSNWFFLCLSGISVDMPKSDSCMKCWLCAEALLVGEVFACYSCLSEHCPNLRNIAARQMVLKERETTGRYQQPTEVVDSTWQEQLVSCATFHSHHSKSIPAKRHVWNVWSYRTIPYNQESPTP